jgi:hypothetical protein
MRKKGNLMAQIHKHFTTEQVKVLLESYQQGHLSREEIEKTLGINKIFRAHKKLSNKP